MPSTECGFLGAGEKPAALLRQFGPTIAVELGYDPQYRHTAKVRPNIPKYEHLALVDTGAGSCCIDAKLAATLGLQVVDRRPIGGVHGQQPANFHIAQMCVPSIQFVMTGLFAGLDLEGGGFAHRAIVGRDLLAHHRMMYDGRTGSVTLTR